MQVTYIWVDQKRRILTLKLRAKDSDSLSYKEKFVDKILKSLDEKKNT